LTREKSEISLKKKMLKEFKEKGKLNSRIPFTKDFKELEQLLQENKRLKEAKNIKPKTMKKV